MWMLIQKLSRTGLLTPGGLLRLLEAVMTTGINLMAMLQVAAKLHPRRLAVCDERERLSYAELWQQAESLAVRLHVDHGISERQKVAIVCRNHTAAIKAIFAISRLGAHVYLINPEMSADQIQTLQEHRKFDFWIYDEQLAGVIQNLGVKALPAYHPTDTSIERLSTSEHTFTRLTKFKSGNIVVLTGGTTGQPKSASRKPSVVNFLPPFVALLCEVHLDRYRSVYIGTPIYHGFGLASLCMGVMLGAEMYFTERFDAERACRLISDNKIEVMTLVPLMLRRMLDRDEKALSSLRCITTGGAWLSPALASETLQRLGPRLFNLYGTSEAGFCIMGTPNLLARKPESIGKPVRGVKARIVNETNQEVGIGQLGRLCIRSAWSISRGSWVETGDLACRDAEGDIFLRGRVDDMIVSGGENVYPIELETVLIQHPDIEAVAVVGISDVEFGQRLKAVVVPGRGTTLNQADLLTWLKPRVARYQMPAIIEFREELPYTSLGKLDKKSLRQ